MNSFEKFQTDLQKATENALSKERDLDLSEVIDRVRNPQINNRRKVEAVLGLFLDKLPGLSSIYEKIAYDAKAVPFVEELTFEGKIGEGTPNVIYLLESQNDSIPSIVIKVRKEGGSIPALQNRAIEEQNEFRMIKEMYPEIPEVIPDEQLILMQSPQRGRDAAVVGIQRFIGRNIKDVFKDIPKEELISMILADDIFKNEVINFFSKTLEHAEQSKKVVDLVGRKNLVVVEENGKKRLRFIDPHWMFSTETGNQWVLDSLRQRLDYMKSILEAIERNS